MTRCEVCPPERNCPGPTCAPDDAHWDGTDAAHPAWWRGHDHTVRVLCDMIMKIIADPKKVLYECGVTAEPWAGTRVAIAKAALAEQIVRAGTDGGRLATLLVYDVLDERTQELGAERTRRVQAEADLAVAHRALEVFAARERREGRA